MSAMVASWASRWFVVRRFTLPLASVQDHSFPRARNPAIAGDHSYILDAYLLEELGQAHLLRRWMKQTFAASCSNDQVATNEV